MFDYIVNEKIIETEKKEEGQEQDRLKAYASLLKKREGEKKNA